MVALIFAANKQHIVQMKADIFQAIADPTRRKILSLTATKAMTPNQLAENFNTSRQAVSKHIKVLTESSLLEQEHIGREIYYRMRPEKLKLVENWVESFRLMMEDRFHELDKILKNQKRNRRL